MTTQHTPTPWEAGPWIDSAGKHVYKVIKGKGRRVGAVSVYGKRLDGSKGGKRYTDSAGIGRTTRTVADAEAEANADLIVRAVNSHEALVEALDTIANKPIGHAEATDREVLSGIVQIARAALAQARGES